MKHKMTLFLEDRLMTDQMRRLDLFHDKKHLAGIVDVIFETTTPVNDEYFMNIIEKSKSFEARILAMEYMNNLYHDPDVLEISDGKHSFFTENWDSYKRMGW